MRHERSAAASPPLRPASSQPQHPSQASSGGARRGDRARGPAEGIRAVLHRALALNGLQNRLERRLPLHVWTAAVGEQIAARARPTVLVRGELHILVQDHRWRDQLDAARNILIERVNARLGRKAVRELRFGLAHTGFLEEGRAFDPVAVAAKVSAALPAHSEAAARLVGDAPLCPDLREALERAASAAVRRAQQS